MIPGLVSRLSETIVLDLSGTLTPKTDVIRITGTTTTTVIATINAPFANMGGLLFIVNGSGAAITAVTTGNVATTCSIPANCVTTLVYSPSAAKWYVDKTL